MTIWIASEGDMRKKFGGQVLLSCLQKWHAEQEAVEWNLKWLEAVNYAGGRQQWESYLVSVAYRVLDKMLKKEEEI